MNLVLFCNIISSTVNQLFDKNLPGVEVVIMLGFNIDHSYHIQLNISNVNVRIDKFSEFMRSLIVH